MSHSTRERLEGYFPFSDDIMGRIEDVAEQQHELGYEEFLDLHGITPDDLKVVAPDNSKPLEVLDLKPRTDYDETHTRVLHLPMGSGMTPNKIVRAATLFAADPTSRLIAVGNPGTHFGHGYGKVPLRDLGKVWKGDLRPTVEPSVRYLNDEGIETSDQLGFSLGADRAATASAVAADYDHGVLKGVFMESASVADRGLVKLTADFKKSDEHYKAYVADCDFPALKESRDQSEGPLTYILALGRLSNIAIANALSKNHFERRVTEAMEAQPEMDVHVIWGEESELALDGAMRFTVAGLQKSFGRRVRWTSLPERHHAMADDIYLHTAIALHGLES